MGQVVDPTLVAVLNSRGYAALQTTRRNAGNTAYEFATGVWTDQSYADPAWLTSLAYGKLTGAPAAVSGANPTATIGTAAVNGSAATFMRSDAAPAFGNLTGDVTSVGMVTTVAKIQGTTVSGTTGTVNVMYSASPTTTGTLTGAAANWSGTQTIAPTAGSGTQAPSLTITGPAHTALTASTESIGANLNFSATKQFATGALTTQREVLIQAPTLAFVGASTVTTAVTFEVASPLPGTNATLTRTIAGRFIASNGAGIPLVCVGGASPTGNLQEWQIAALTNVASVSAGGNFTMGNCTLASAGTLSYGGAFTIARNGSTGVVTALLQNNSGSGFVLDNSSGNAGTIPLTLKNVAARTQPALQLQTSAAGSLGNVSGGCFADVIAAASTTHTDGTFDTLKTITFVANSLIANGDKHYFDFTLTFVGHATATRDVKLAFAGITIFDSGALTPGTGTTTVRLTGYISRVTSTTAIASISWDASGGAGLALATADIQTFVPAATLTGLTLSGTNNLVLSAAAAGAGAASADISVVHGTAGVIGFGS